MVRNNMSSHPLIVRGVAIGDGIPKICVPVLGRGRAEVLASLKQAMAAEPDLLEWRIDYLEDISPEAVTALLAQVRDEAGDTPLLVTFRTKEEGGARAISCADYIALLSAVLNTGYADLIDMEQSAEHRWPDSISDLIGVQSQARAAHVPVIGSFHDFSSTPSQAELLERMERIYLCGYDIVKIAVMPHSPDDVLTLLNATVEMNRLHPDRPLITMSMGQMGMVSRISGAVFSSAVTFGSAGQASAPGQIPVAELRKALALLRM